MLLAVEGGGFFSSSASGYSKGLTLLLLGQQSEDKPMKVAPWNQYQLVDEDIGSDLQLASGKRKLPRGCASFTLFGCVSAGHEGQYSPKIGPTKEKLVVAGENAVVRDKELANNFDNGDIARNRSLKSSLKKRSHDIQPSDKPSNEQDALGEDCGAAPDFTERRKVQWADACGKELAEIREFEQSEVGGSDDEFKNEGGKTCSCQIM